LYPQGDAVVGGALARMGFASAMELEVNKAVDISGLETSGIG
jgi:hypothetical protein